MKQTKFLLSCPVFKEEIELCLSSKPGIVIEYLDDSIHMNPDRMKGVLEKEILKKKNFSDDISLLVGCDCHCDVPIKQIAENSKVKIPLEKNCTEIILGPERTKLFQKGKTSVITNSWVEMRKRLIDMGLWSEVDEHIASGYFDRLLLLEYGTTSLKDEEILSLYDFFQVPIETEKVDLNYFKSVLKGLLERKFS